MCGFRAGYEGAVRITRNEGESVRDYRRGFKSARRGTALLRLTLLAGLVIGLVPSPASATFPGQNGRIAYNATGGAGIGGDLEIFTVNPDGTGIQQLTNNQSSDAFPTWSPDGTRIAFESDREGDNDIWIMNADGSNPRNVTGAIAGNEYFPTWSPDGTRLAFRGTYGTDLDGEIYTVRLNGTGLTRLTNNTAFDGRPEWSPNGDRIVFVSLRDGNSEIYAVNAGGGGETRLTTNIAFDGFPTWTPDGQRIVFKSNRSGDFDLYTMSPDGSNVTLLLSGIAGVDETQEADGVVSPDGTLIAFTSNRLGPDPDIWVSNLDGTNARNVTHDAGLDSAPDWQPLGGVPLPPGGIEPGDYKNRAHYCKALREALGGEEFAGRYGNGIGGCVSGHRGQGSGGNGHGHGNGKGHGKH
jgi:Tol biopolymer transport system component